jgi:hypothetical protein
MAAKFHKPRAEDKWVQYTEGSQWTVQRVLTEDIAVVPDQAAATRLIKILEAMDEASK